MKEQPEALRIAAIMDSLGGNMSLAASELCRLHERDVKADAKIKELLQTIEDFEHQSALLSQRVQEMEAMLYALLESAVFARDNTW